MQRREQQLLIGFIAVGGLALGMKLVHSVVVQPFEDRGAQVESLNTAIKKKTDDLLVRAVAEKRLKQWRSMSLPPDENSKPSQGSAWNAQRLYLQWLTDLSQLCGFESLKILPGTQKKEGDVYVSLVVKIDGEARYEQVVRWLDLFYRTELLHRVTALHINTKVFEGDPQLSVSIEAEGLVILDTPPRQTLFPETRLASQLSDDATTLEVTGATEFPTKESFLVQIKNEFVRVKSIGEDNKWQIERGVERTLPAAYPDGTSVQLVRWDPNQPELTLAEFRKLIATDIFVKPAPPYRLKINPLGEKTITRGRPNEFTIVATGYDTLLGKPEFVVIGDAPAGFKLDRTGRVTWRPEAEVANGKYDIKFDVQHPSAPGGALQETLSMRVRDPKPTPKLNSDAIPAVFLNREWTYRPELAETNPPIANLNWKLGDRSPTGMTINSRTGELKWTPGDEVSLGNLTLSVVVSDNDTPPQSTTIPIKLEVKDDAAQFTRLTGVFIIGENKRAFLADQSRNYQTELREGDTLAISDVNGKISLIGPRHVIVSLGKKDLRWDIGDSLREAQAKMKDRPQ